MNVGFLSEPRPPVALTPEQSRAFALVGQAGPGGYRVPAAPRDAAARLRDALYALERHGLAMPAGPAWKLTPRGWERYADALAAASGKAPGAKRTEGEHDAIRQG